MADREPPRCDRCGDHVASNDRGPSWWGHRPYNHLCRVCTALMADLVQQWVEHGGTTRSAGGSVHAPRLAAEHRVTATALAAARSRRRMTLWAALAWTAVATVGVATMWAALVVPSIALGVATIMLLRSAADDDLDALTADHERASARYADAMLED